MKKILFGVLIAVIASAPYIYGYFRSPAGLVFLGRSVVNSADTYTYLANIQSAKEGMLIFFNLYTTESTTPFMIRPTYLFLGLLARIFNLEAIVAYHLGRVIYTIVFVYVLSKFINIFLKDKNKQIVAFIIVLFSSGVGFFVKAYSPISIDLWVPEANTFFSLLESPHFISTLIFMLLSLYYFIYFMEKGSNKYIFLSSIFSSLIILDYPYLLPFVYIYYFLLFIIFIRGRNLNDKILIISKFFTLPLVSGLLVYLALVMSPSAQLWYEQNILPTPSLNDVVTGYGILLIFLLFTFNIFSMKNKKISLLMIWVVLTFILIYSPLSFQRRILEGLHIPISILASLGILYLIDRIRMKLFRIVLLIFLLSFLSVTNIYNVLMMIGVFSKDSVNNYTYYLDNDEMTGMKWLADYSKYQEVILANSFYSNILPGVTGRYVYHGHRVQTYKPVFKQRNFQRFMENSDVKARITFLRENKITYIYLGKNDPYNIYRSSFENLDLLEKIFDSNGVLIYKVR